MKNTKYKQVIVLDFDHTLFNTTAFIDRLQELFQLFGIDRTEFNMHRQELKECCHLDDIDVFIGRLSHPDKKALHNLVHATIEKEAHLFVFRDVSDFLKRHRDTFDIMILTQGDKEMQTEKIRHSKLPFEIPFIITREGKEQSFQAIVNSHEKIYFIDDKAENIYLVKTTFPIVETYFIKRPDDSPYASIALLCDCADHVVEDLLFTIR